MKKKFSLLKKILLSPIQEFIQDSRAIGIVLMACTLVSLIISNTGWGHSFVGFWEKDIHLPFENIHLPHSVAHWINDGLMAVFFLLVGMEIKRELVTGELSSLKKSILPVLAAIGGMLFPALLYYGWNTNSGFPQGWGVPMATDIAFSLGILSLLGKRVPLSLKILLTALAIIDDLGAIVAIAVFYTDHIDWMYLGIGGVILLVLFLMNKFKVKTLLPYYILGLGLWYCLFNSGVHATLAGVLLAFTIPVKRISFLEHKLHDPVSFIILPLFALANTAIIFPAEMGTALASPINYGILSGLIIGKPLGIALVSYCAVKFKLAALPEDLNWKYIIGMGLLAGIGFTMSIFISMLAFKDYEAQTTAKLAVIIASLASGLLGFIYLKMISKKKTFEG
jgi:NhaA family Na+:H+ antiporter